MQLFESHQYEAILLHSRQFQSFSSRLNSGPSSSNAAPSSRTNFLLLSVASHVETYADQAKAALRKALANLMAYRFQTSILDVGGGDEIKLVKHDEAVALMKVLIESGEDSASIMSISL